MMAASMAKERNAAFTVDAPHIPPRSVHGAGYQCVENAANASRFQRSHTFDIALLSILCRRSNNSGSTGQDPLQSKAQLDFRRGTAKGLIQPAPVDFQESAKNATPPRLSGES